jgi:hypothetical protein
MFEPVQHHFDGDVVLDSSLVRKLGFAHVLSERYHA